MSLRAVVEIVIHLESFRNIDLFFQDIYYTRFRIHSRKKQQEILSARGTNNTTSNSQANDKKNNTAANTSQAN